MWTLNSTPLRNLTGLAFGLALPLAALISPAGAINPLAHRVGEIVAQAAASHLQALAIRQGVAEVAIAFDARGRLTGAEVRRSTGSRGSDAAAVDAALELASLRRPADVAGRTLLIRANLDVRAAAEIQSPKA